MKFIIEHGEKVLTVVIVVLCAAFIATKLSPGEDLAAQDLKANSEKIDRILRKGEVAEGYRWNTAKKENYAATLTEHMKRPNANSAAPASYVAYPRPPRPFVDPELKPKELPKEVAEVEAVATAPAELTAKGDHGSVYIAVRLPKTLEFMVPVRIEVFRGTDPKKVEELVGSIPVGTEEYIDFGNLEEEKKEEEPEPEAEAAEEPKPGADQMSARERKKLMAAAEKAEKAEEELANIDVDVDVPAEYKEYYVLRDAPVKPKVEYFYRARLVCKPTKTNASGYVVKDGKQFDVTVPETLTPVKPTKADSKVKLYATPFTDVVSDRTPPNFVLRFSGVIGNLPDPNVPVRFQGTPSYQGNFELKVWVPKAFAWKTVTIQTPVTEILKGDIRYQNYQTKAWEIFKFDTGYKLVEIKPGFDRVMSIQQVPLMKKTTNEAGEEVEVPVMDEVTGRPKMTQKQIERKVPTKMAMLEDTATGDIEEHPQRQNFEARKDAFVYYDRLLKGQEELQAKRAKALKDMMNKK